MPAGGWNECRDCRRPDTDHAGLLHDFTPKGDYERWVADEQARLHNEMIARQDMAAALVGGHPNADDFLEHLKALVVADPQRARTLYNRWARRSGLRAV